MNKISLFLLSSIGAMAWMYCAKNSVDGFCWTGDISKEVNMNFTGSSHFPMTDLKCRFF